MLPPHTEVALWTSHVKVPLSSIIVKVDTMVRLSIQFSLGSEDVGVTVFNRVFAAEEEEEMLSSGR